MTVNLVGHRWVYSVEDGVIAGRTSVLFDPAATETCGPEQPLVWPSVPNPPRNLDYLDGSREYVLLTSGPHRGRYVSSKWVA